MKLPDLPEYAIGPTIDGVRYKPPSLSTTQVRAIQREAAIWALEEAARVCENGSFLHDDAPAARFAWEFSKALRALKEQIDD